MNLKHSDWNDVVVNTEGGAFKYSLALNKYFAIILGVSICFAGFPINFDILTRILIDKTLRKKPRCILQLFATLSSIFVLSLNGLKLIYFVLGPFDLLCLFIMSIVGLPYNHLLFNLFLSFFDCFIAITFPLWQRRNVTVRLILFCLIVLNLLLALAIKWIFITGQLPVLICALQTNHFLPMEVSALVLLVLCVVSLIGVFIQTWGVLPWPSRSIPLPTRWVFYKCKYGRLQDV